MLSGISLSGPIGEILAAAAMVVAALAGIWACWRVIGLFAEEFWAEYEDATYDDGWWSEEDERDFQEHQKRYRL